MNLLWFQIMEDCMVFMLAGCAITANCKLKSPDQLCGYSIELISLINILTKYIHYTIVITASYTRGHYFTTVGGGWW